MNPSAEIESGEARRPTTDDGVRGRGRAGAGANPVGICEKELIGEPQEGQKRLVSGSSAEQWGQRIKLPES